MKTLYTSEIFDIIKNYEIQIVNFVFIGNSSLKLHKIYFDSSFIDDKFLLNEIENPFCENEKMILPNLNLFFLNFFSSRPSIEFFCHQKLLKNFVIFFEDLKTKNIKIFFEKPPMLSFFMRASKDCDENLIHDFFSEIFEYSNKIDSKFFCKNRPKKFFIQEVFFDDKFCYSHVFLEIESLNEREGGNFVEFFCSLLILKKIIQNISKNFGFNVVSKDLLQADESGENFYDLKMFFKILFKDKVILKDPQFSLKEGFFYENFIKFIKINL